MPDEAVPADEVVPRERMLPELTRYLSAEDARRREATPYQPPLRQPVAVPLATEEVEAIVAEEEEHYPPLSSRRRKLVPDEETVEEDRPPSNRKPAPVWYPPAPSGDSDDSPFDRFREAYNKASRRVSKTGATVSSRPSSETLPTDEKVVRRMFAELENQNDDLREANKAAGDQIRKLKQRVLANRADAANAERKLQNLTVAYQSMKTLLEAHLGVSVSRVRRVRIRPHTAGGEVAEALAVLTKAVDKLNLPSAVPKKAVASEPDEWDKAEGE